MTDRPAEDKALAYKEVLDEIVALMNDEGGWDLDEIALMASVNSILTQRFDTYFWTGFYRVCGNRLIVGPYIGTVGCLQIEFGKGVCGAVAVSRKTLIVDDVHQFPGHIACDSRSRSEIVVPVFGRDKSFIGVLDVDSEKLAAFDEDDKAGLEAICELFQR